MKYLLISLSFFLQIGLSFKPIFAQTSKIKIDSLERILSRLQVKDTNRFQLLKKLCWQLRNSNPQKALKYGKEALNLSNESSENNKDAEINTFVGTVYRNLGDYPKALGYFLTAAKIAEKKHDIESLGFALQSVADLNQRQKNFTDAFIYLAQALKHFEKIKHQVGIGYTYYTYGQTYEGKKDYQKSLEYHFKALKIRQKLPDRNALASSQFRIGGVFQKIKQYTEAIHYLDEAEKNFEETHDLRGIAQVLHLEAQTYLAENELINAEKQAKAGLALAQKNSLKEQLADFYADLTQIYQIQKDFTQAFDYQTLYLAYRDSLFNQEKANQMNYLQTSFEDEKAQIQLKLLREENQRKTLFNYAISLGLLLIGLLALVLYRNNLLKQKTNRVLSLANQEIEEKNKKLQEAFTKIEAQHIHIQESIDYAQRIQRAMLPQTERVSQVLPESFILYKPRDIVSGDFYWIYETPEEIILVAADCTGHGVPGALMSMIGEALLDQIVDNRKIHRPDLILNELHREIRINLHQFESKNQDGMDIVVCKINPKLKKLQFAGAINPLYYVQENQFRVVKGDKFGIGGYFHEIEDRKFTYHEIDISQPTTLYLTSDGFQDQFGGDKGRKFMLGNFRKLLTNLASLPISTQKNQLEKTLNDWMKPEYPQTDDILILGVHFA